MIKIGYIYRYNEKEGKGILVYGYNRNTKNIQTKPILFSKSQCLSPVETGQIAYFELEDGFHVSQIERASLANFKREILSNIVSCYDSQELSKCHEATTIKYENLEDINLQGKLRKITKRSDKSVPRTISEIFDLFEANYCIRRRREELGAENQNTNDRIPESIDELFSLLKGRFRLHKHLDQLQHENIKKNLPRTQNELFALFESQYVSRRKEVNSLIEDVEIINKLPDDIEELYTLFGNQEHQIYHFGNNADDTCSIDILDIAHWFDKDIAKSKELYGRTAEQVLDIFELFVQKRRNAYINSPSCVDYTMSPAWKPFLSNLSTEYLREICIKEPTLQPALPRKFCLENLDVLSIDQWFPSVSICEAYYRYRISNTNSLAEYKSLFNWIQNAAYCIAEHKKDVGVPPCKMKKRVLHELKDLLEDQFRTVVLVLLKQKVTLISNGRIDEEKVTAYYNPNNKDYLFKLDRYVSIYDCVLDNCDYWQIEDYVNAFNDLSDDDRESLKAPYSDKAKACVFKIAKSKYESDKVFRLYSALQVFSDVLTYDTIEEVRRIVNCEFAGLSDFKELNDAYLSDMITEDQIKKRYKELTINYSIEELMRLIANTDMPVSVQEYVVRNIIQKFNFNNNHTEEYVTIDHDVIYTKEALVIWLNEQNDFRLDCQLKNKIALELVSDLDKDTRWRMFENGFISSPSYDNIREKLDYAYSHKEPEDLYRYISSDCFQQVMADDAVNRTDFDKLSFILKHLNNDYKNWIKGYSSELLHFYLWAIEPNKDINRISIKKYFHSLPYYTEIRIFRYLFYLMAKGYERYSVVELRNLITNDNQFKVCKLLDILLFLLEKKSSDLKESISNKEFRTMAGIDFFKSDWFMDNIYDLHLQDLLGGVSIETNGILTYEGFFDKCKGHRLPSWEGESYISFNGVIEECMFEGKPYFSISFYPYPAGIRQCYKNNKENNIFRAKNALEINFPYTVINENIYLIPTCYRQDLKEYVIQYQIYDYRCLLNDNNGVTAPLHTYRDVQTINDNYSFCKGCKKCRSFDPKYKIPFYWCDKEPCISPRKLLTPTEEWETYKFVDLLNILYKNDMSIRDALWDAEAEISQFLNSFVINAEETADSCPIIVSDEIGEWKEDMSIMSDKCLDDDYDDEFDNDYRYDPNSERATYDKYSGSYAQDEMGYSDDEIDTIFDGDPDAYWNID